MATSKFSHFSDLVPKLGHVYKAKGKVAFIGLKNKVLWWQKQPKIFLKIKCERVKNYLRDISEVMAAKEKQNTELFDLCKKAAALKQITIVSSAKDPKKTIGGEIINKWEQISSTKYFNAWTYLFSNIPEFSLRIHMLPWLICFAN